MTETSNAASAPPPAKGCRRVARGCGVVLLLVIVAFAALSFRASRRLDGRVTALREQIAKARVAQPAARPVILGAPVDGNAVLDYQAIEWVLQPRSSWNDPPAGMPATDLPKHHTKTTHSGYTFSVSDELLDKGGPLPPQAESYYETYKVLGRHLRDGLRRSRCDWAFPYERAMFAELPSLLASRAVANLLALEASRVKDPADSARIGLEIVLYGKDIGRQPTIIGKMIGIAIEGIGCRSLERTLRTSSLPRAAYEQLVSVLDRAGPVELTDAFVAEHVGIAGEIARLSGRPLDPTTASAPGFVGGGLVDRVLFALGPAFFEHEWSEYERVIDLVKKDVALPFSRRAVSGATLEADLEKSWSIFVNIAVPNLRQTANRADQANALRELVRMAAAAHLHRLEKGALPAQADALAPYLGGKVPADPFRDGAALSLRVEGDELRFYSWGENGTDDQGNPDKNKDVVVRTRVPPR